MNQLPENIKEADGMMIKVRDDAPEHTKQNFGLKPYAIMFSNNDKLQLAVRQGKMRMEELIRLHPYNEETHTLEHSVHTLITLMSWDKIREKFEVIGKY